MKDGNLVLYRLKALFHPSETPSRELVVSACIQLKSTQKYFDWIKTLLLHSYYILTN